MNVDRGTSCVSDDNDSETESSELLAMDVDEMIYFFDETVRTKKWFAISQNNFVSTLGRKLSLNAVHYFILLILHIAKLFLSFTPACTSHIAFTCALCLYVFTSYMSLCTTWNFSTNRTWCLAFLLSFGLM